MAAAESLPVLYVRAKNIYELGKTIGETFKGWIGEYLESSADVACLRKFYQSENGRRLYDGYLQSSIASHPHIVDEIRGMADGSHQKFEDIFLLQISPEIIFSHAVQEEDVPHKPDPVNEVKGCTDVMINTEDFRMVGHNEDWTAEISRFVYVVHATLYIESNGEVTEQFASFAYPGYLAGYTFGMNRHLVITLNTILPPKPKPEAVPLNILLRTTLGCKTVKQCETVLKNKPYGCSFGMNLNIASIHGTEMCSLEVYPGKPSGLVSTHYIPYGSHGNPSSFYPHTNIYRHLNAKSILGEGSRLREKRVLEIGTPSSQKDICNILGDTSDPREAIFRIPTKMTISKKAQSIATAIIDLTLKKLDVFRGNPKYSDPVASIPFL